MSKMKPRGPFAYKRTKDAGVPVDVYEAEFQLADDGTPGSDRYLVVRVEVEKNDTEPLVHLYIKSGGRMVHVSQGVTNVKLAANLLYGAAHLKVVELIEPL